MAYSPTELNEPPVVDKDYDPAAEPTAENPNVFKLAEQQAAAAAEAAAAPADPAQPKPVPATTYNTGNAP